MFSSLLKIWFHTMLRFFYYYYYFWDSFNSLISVCWGEKVQLLQIFCLFLNPISRKTSALLPHLLSSVCRLLYSFLVLRQLPLEAERQQHISAVNGFYKSLIIIISRRQVGLFAKQKKKIWNTSFFSCFAIAFWKMLDSCSCLFMYSGG